MVWGSWVWKRHHISTLIVRTIYSQLISATNGHGSPCGISTLLFHRVLLECSIWRWNAICMCPYRDRRLVSRHSTNKDSSSTSSSPSAHRNGGTSPQRCNPPSPLPTHFPSQNSPFLGPCIRRTGRRIRRKRSPRQSRRSTQKGSRYALCTILSNLSY